MFFPLSISHRYLGDRAGVKSIMAGTLIELLRQSLFPGDGVPPSLADIISSPGSYPMLTIGTLAVPEFEKYSVPRYGFKTFGLLSRIPQRLEQPPPEFLFRGEICAVHSDEDPVTQQFQKNWSSGWRLDLTTFFIILFVEHFRVPSRSLLRNAVDRSPSSPFQRAGANYNSPGLSESRTTDLFRYSPGDHTPSPLGDFSQPLVDHSPGIQSLISPQSYFPFDPSASLSEPTYKSSPPQTDHLSAEALGWKSFAEGVSSQPVQLSISPFYTYTNPVPDLMQNEAQPPHVQPEQSHPESQSSNSPPAELVQTSNSPLDSLASSPRSQSVDSSVASPVPEVSRGQVHTTAILDVCRKVGCTDDLIQRAIRKTKREKQTDGGILVRILNYLAMAEVLTTMGYQSHAPDTTGEVMHQCNGTVMTGSELVGAFGWSIHSYRHKNTWFSWAARAVQTLRWNPEIETESEDCFSCSTDLD